MSSKNSKYHIKITPEQWQFFYKSIGYIFKDNKLCQQALTHRSFGALHNERLEFLGDSIIGVVIAGELFNKFPNATEGQLTRLKSKLVRGETLTKLAINFKLTDYLQLGLGELKSGGAVRESILEDAFESIVGAAYLDSGEDFQLVKDLILVWFKDLLDNLNINLLKDPKTRLQEHCQADGYLLPIYNLDKVTGKSPNQIFYVSVGVNGGSGLSASSSGNSRKIAEQKAAEKLLAKMG